MIAIGSLLQFLSQYKYIKIDEGYYLLQQDN